jgi:hypothetical protein
MMCPVKLANEMSGLSGTLSSSMTRFGHEADERSRSERIPALNPCAEAHDPSFGASIKRPITCPESTFVYLTVLSMPQVSFEFL